MMGERADLLFFGNDLYGVLQHNLDQAKSDVEQISEAQFIHSSDADLVEHVYSVREIISIDLHEDRMEVTPQETQVDVSNHFNRAVFDRSRPTLVPGLRIIVSIPFSGNANLWLCKPSTYTLNPPQGRIQSTRDNNGGYLEIVLQRPSDTLDDGGAIKREIENTLSSIRGYLKNSKNDIDAHNQQLRGHIQQCVASRRLRLGKHADIVKSLNIPLKKKPGAPDLTALPIRRKLIKPLPLTSTTPTEHGLRDEDYEHILSVIRHEGRSFEATPKTFAKHDEEGLRDIILAHLNGHYEGDASSEAFRRTGKTDILIEYAGRAAFVGECKVWHGQKQLKKSLDQLLRYLTWRDCRTALIVFNRNVKGFSEIQSTLAQTLEQHPGFIESNTTTQLGEWRIWLRDEVDEARKITVHVFLFNLYVPGNSKESVISEP